MEGRSLQRILQEEDFFFIVSHILPDGDSIGSCIAMALALEKMGKRVKVFSCDPVPNKYLFLRGSSLITQEVDSAGYSVLLVLDCSDLSRTGLPREVINSFSLVINIDHHVTNTGYGHVNLIDPEAAATGEIIYRLLEEMDLPVNKDIAVALYTAILTDTGSFKYENTTPETHRVVAELLEHGVSVAVSQRIYDDYPLQYILLLKETLSTLEMWEEGSIASLTVSKELMLRCRATMENLDGIINYVKNIETVEIGILFYLSGDEEIKVALRSKNVDVSKLAGAFNGGGHLRAAGFRINVPYHQAKNEVIQASIDALGELKKQEKVNGRRD